METRIERYIFGGAIICIIVAAILTRDEVVAGLSAHPGLWLGLGFGMVRYSMEDRAFKSKQKKLRKKLDIA